jgi:hypothetical protein
MHGVGLDADVREWFEPRGKKKSGVPRTTVPRNLIEKSLS